MGGFPRSLQFSTSVSDLAEGRGSETKIFREESLRLARDPFKAYKQSKASQRPFLRPGVSRRRAASRKQRRSTVFQQEESRRHLAGLSIGHALWAALLQPPTPKEELYRRASIKALDKHLPVY